MSHWEGPGAFENWLTPKYIFDALGVEFDLDVAAPKNGAPNVPAKRWLYEHALEVEWNGFIWMNPPFGGRNGVIPWLSRFVTHSDGIALVPDRTSAPWFQSTAPRVSAILFMSPKVKFERADGSLGKWPSTGTALMAIGERGQKALQRAKGVLGILMRSEPWPTNTR